MVLSQFGVDVALVALILLDGVALAATWVAARWAAQRFRWLPDELLEYLTGDQKQFDVPWVIGSVTGLVLELPRFFLSVTIVGGGLRSGSMFAFARFRIFAVPLLVVAGFMAGSTLKGKKSDPSDELNLTPESALPEKTTVPEPTAPPPPPPFNLGTIVLAWAALLFSVMNGLFVTYWFNPSVETQMKWGAAIIVITTLRAVGPAILSITAARRSRVARVIGSTAIGGWTAGFFIGQGLIPRGNSRSFDSSTDGGELIATTPGRVGFTLLGTTIILLLVATIRAWRSPDPVIPSVPATPQPVIPPPLATPAPPSATPHATHAPAEPSPVRATPTPPATPPQVAETPVSLPLAPPVLQKKRIAAAARPAPAPMETWKVATFSPAAKPAPETARRVEHPKPVVRIVAVAAIVVAVLGIATYALTRSDSDPVAEIKSTSELNAVAEPQALEQPVPVETVEGSIPAESELPPKLFPMRSFSELEPFPNCVAIITYTWELDPAEAPPAGAVATVRYQAPGQHRTFDAEYDGSMVVFAREISLNEPGKYRASLLRVGDRRTLFKTPLLYSVFGC